MRGLVAKLVALGVICACGALVCLLGCVAAKAQQQDLNGVAAKIAQKLGAAKAKKVVVFDFVGPGRGITAFGVKCADDFSAALSQSHQKFRVVDRTHIAESEKIAGYRPEDLIDPGSIIPLGSFLGADAVVLGSISVDNSQVTISIHALHMSGGRVNLIDKQDIITPASDDAVTLLLDYLVRTTTEAGGKNDLSAVGMDGYSYPQCERCPNAVYSQEALNLKLEGTVELRVVITTEGTAEYIHVIKALGAGLDQEAIAAVKKWKFRPATTPDGRPVAVRQIIEVTFHFY